MVKRILFLFPVKRIFKKIFNSKKKERETIAMAFVKLYVLLFNCCLIYSVYSIDLEHIKLRLKNRVSQ